MLLAMLTGELQPGGPPGSKIAAVMEASVERQRAAARQQASATEPVGAFFILPPPSPLMPRATPFAAAAADCPALNELELQPLIEEAAREAALPPEKLRDLIRQKSGGRPCAVSPGGAQGLLQLMPATLAEFAVADPLDPRQNLSAGGRLLKRLLDLHAGDWGRALAAYDGAGRDLPPASAVPAPAQNQRAAADKSK